MDFYLVVAPWMEGPSVQFLLKGHFGNTTRMNRIS